MVILSLYCSSLHGTSLALTADSGGAITVWIESSVPPPCLCYLLGQANTVEAITVVWIESTVTSAHHYMLCHKA